jgi:hypothetical protein
MISQSASQGGMKHRQSPHFPVIFRTYIPFKGTWQRGGFSGVFAEIGPA